MKNPRQVARRLVEKFLDRMDNNFGPDESHRLPMVYEMTEADRIELVDLIAAALSGPEAR